MRQALTPSLYDPRYLHALLNRHGVHLSKRFGQNFLIDPDVPDRIVRAASLDADTLAVEIGPGVGALTVSLAETAGAVLAFEVDTRLAPLLSETLASCGNVTLVWQDVLKADLTEVIAAHQNGRRLTLCANLPYSITTPVLTHLLESRLFPEMVVMVQREVAQRIAADPGTKAYGAFSLFVQTKATAEILFDVPPDAFFPAPQVTSSVLRLTAAPTPLFDEALFFRLVRAAFAQRRKTLLNALSAATHYTRDTLTAALTDCGLSPTARGETLGIAQYDALCRRLNALSQG